MFFSSLPASFVSSFGRPWGKIHLGIFFLLMSTWGCSTSSEPILSGELKTWHPITLTFNGPECKEIGQPNPFSDYRMVVDFRQGPYSFRVPGYFAADGDAGESGATSGNQWRVHFSPGRTGTWEWEAHFHQGPEIALSDDLEQGEALAFDGASGSFQVAPTDKEGVDFRRRGRLEYVERHFLRFAGSKKLFIKGGADAPEVFLAYTDIDCTYAHDGKTEWMKHWQPHVQDWKAGDPTWKNGKGKGIIGALNYLASKGMNAVSFLTMNVEGDGKNVWPWVSDHDFYHFDCSKLDQWNIIFSHAQRLGIYLHFKTQETENDHLLDEGELGPSRKLYYRELIARFGHHLALGWNLGEENTQSTEQQVAMADYFHAHDPYQHLIVLHTYPNKHQEVYAPLTGSKSELTGISLQTSFDKVHDDTKKWVRRTMGKPWVVTNDEQGHWSTGVTPDADYPGMDGRPDNHREIRGHTVWGNLMAGGAGVEFYFGYEYPESDLSCNDWRSRDQMWDYTRYALEFFQEHLRFWLLHSVDEWISEGSGFCTREEKGPVVAYFFQAESCIINLENAGSMRSLGDKEPTKFSVQWYNPRTGGALQTGEKEFVYQAERVDLGAPPGDPSEDWVVLLKEL